MNVTDKISVLGDSIMKGVILDEVSKKYKLWKENAVNMFANTTNALGANYSKFGSTSKYAVQNFPSLLEKDNNAKYVLVEFGGNDCDYNWDEVSQNPLQEHKPNVPLEEFSNYLQELITKIKNAGKVPFVMSLPPIDSEKYFTWISKNCEERAKKIMAFLKEKSLIYRHQELYSRTLEAIARKNDLFIVRVREAFLSIKNYADYLCLDGIHPNALGQRIIRQVFEDTYNKIINSAQLSL